jgi:hypothetical protein
VRVLKNFFAEVSWGHCRAVLKFGADRRKTILSVTSDSENQLVFWPVRVIKRAQVKSFIQLIPRVVIKVGAAVSLGALFITDPVESVEFECGDRGEAEGEFSQRSTIPAWPGSSSS